MTPDQWERVGIVTLLILGMLGGVRLLLSEKIILAGQYNALKEENAKLEARYARLEERYDKLNEKSYEVQALAKELVSAVRDLQAEHQYERETDRRRTYEAEHPDPPGVRGRR